MFYVQLTYFGAKVKKIPGNLLARDAGGNPLGGPKGLVPGTYFSYQYDGMGNRTHTGGLANLDFSGTSLDAWGANANNQIDLRH
jgi:hypothetical protein